MNETQTIPLTCRQCSHRVRVPREWWEPAEAVEVRGLCPKCTTGSEKDESWDYYDADGNEVWQDVRHHDDDVIDVFTEAACAVDRVVYRGNPEE